MKSSLREGWQPIPPYSNYTRHSALLKCCFALFLPLILFVSTTTAQTFPPPNTSCTSKDLALVGAALPPPGGNPCATCSTGQALSRTLTLSINNTTSSTRTSFAFWGTLEITHANGSVTTSPLSGCNGPIAKNTITSLPYGNINFVCGDAIKIKNLFLAWTDASPGSTCPLNPNTINPKCGTLPEITVNAGLNGNTTQTNVTCFGANTGAIDLTPFGGAPPYTYSWSNGATTQDLTGLAAGTYTCTITDNTSPVKCTATRSVTITGPSAGLTLGTCSKTDVTCFGGANGSVSAGTVSNAVGTPAYSWKNSSNVVIATTANKSNLAAGTYTLTVTDNCSSQTCNVTVGGPSAGLTLGTCSKTDVTCFGGSNGSVSAGTVSNAVGTPSYSWKNSSNVVVATTANKTNLPAGTYTLTVTDNCSSQTCNVTVGGPSAGLTLGTCSKTDVTCFGDANGSVSAGTVSNAVGTPTYSWKNSSNVEIATTANKSNLPAGTYTLTVTDNCSSVTCSVTVGGPSAIPAKPTLCVVQPTLCSSTGSITVTSPTGTGYQYSKDGGTTWQTSPTFTGLAAGSNPSIIYKNSAGCISGATSCSDLATNCGGNNRIGSITETIISRPSDVRGLIQPDQQTPVEIKAPATLFDQEFKIGVKAFPNPFNDRVKFVVTLPEAGNGSLEVVNLLGQKIKTIYQGHLSAGSQTFEMNVPPQQRSSLIYILKVGNNRLTGKLLNSH